MSKKNTPKLCFAHNLGEKIGCQLRGKGGGGGLVAKSVFQNLFFFCLKSSFIVRFINVKKCWFYLFAQHSSSKKSTCPHIRIWKKLNFDEFWLFFLPIVWSNFQYFTRVFPNCFFFFDYLSHLCKNYFWKKNRIFHHIQTFWKIVFFLCTVTHTIFLQNRQYYRKVRNNKKTHFEKPHILKYFYQNQFVRLVRETVFLFSDVMKITP